MKRLFYFWMLFTILGSAAIIWYDKSEPPIEIKAPAAPSVRRVLLRPWGDTNLMEQGNIPHKFTISEAVEQRSEQ
jgi:hypothetical protein